MTERNNPEAKRQEALERLRQRRGEARRAIPQNQEDREDSEISSFQRLREIRADVARGADVSGQSELEAEEKNAAKALQRRQSRRVKRQQQLDLPGDNEAIASLQGEDEKLVETFRQIQQARRANRPGKKTPQRRSREAPRKRRDSVDAPVYPTDLIREIHQQLLGEIEIALSDTPLEQLEQRRKDLKYRYDWLQSLLEEMREELDRVQEHIISRLLTSQPSETPQPPSNS